MRPIVTVTVATCSVSGVKLCIYPHNFEGIELMQIVRPKFIGYAYTYLNTRLYIYYKSEIQRTQ